MCPETVARRRGDDFCRDFLGTATGKRLRLGRRDSYSEFTSAAPQLPNNGLQQDGPNDKYFIWAHLIYDGTIHCPNFKDLTQDE
jgi:hypothetical protein